MQIYHGLGRRKTAVAQVNLLPGTGKFMVNDLAFDAYFSTTDMRQTAQSPLVLTSQQTAFDFNAKIHGGGKRSQADALRLAIARALLEVDTKWRKQLKEAKMLVRDAREKERKKPGLKRARRAPQFSKR